MIEHAMAEAWAQARLTRGWCAPNPAVGAVVIQDGQIMGRGCHHGPGTAHAEVAACQGLAPNRLKGATLVVTLEPCCHHGRTPPCTEFIISQGIARVVYAVDDPNPNVAGRSQAILEAAGVNVHRLNHPGLMRWYTPYRHWWQHHRPWVTLKMACNSQGVMASRYRKPLALSHEPLNALTHVWRKQVDLIMTSQATLLNDAPRLNARWHGQAVTKPLAVIASGGDGPCLNAWPCVHWFSGHEQGPQGAHHHRTPVCRSGQLDLGWVLTRLAELGYHHLWVEAGPTLSETMLAQGWVDEWLCYLACNDARPGYGIPAEANLGGPWQGRWQALPGGQVLWHAKRQHEE